MFSISLKPLKRRLRTSTPEPSRAPPPFCIPYSAEEVAAVVSEGGSGASSPDQRSSEEPAPRGASARPKLLSRQCGVAVFLLHSSPSHERQQRSGRRVLCCHSARDAEVDRRFRLSSVDPDGVQTWKLMPLKHFRFVFHFKNVLFVLTHSGFTMMI